MVRTTDSSSNAALQNQTQSSDRINRVRHGSVESINGNRIRRTTNQVHLGSAERVISSFSQSVMIGASIISWLKSRGKTEKERQSLLVSGSVPVHWLSYLMPPNYFLSFNSISTPSLIQLEPLDEKKGRKNSCKNPSRRPLQNQFIHKMVPFVQDVPLISDAGCYKECTRRVFRC